MPSLPKKRPSETHGAPWGRSGRIQTVVAPDFLASDCACPAHAATFGAATFPGVAEAQALRDGGAALLRGLAEIECTSPRVRRGILLQQLADRLRGCELLLREIRANLLRLQYETAEGELATDYIPLRDPAGRVRGGVER